VYKHAISTIIPERPVELLEPADVKQEPAAAQG